MTNTTPKTPQPSSETEEPIIFAQLKSKVRAVAISPDGRKVIAGLENGELQLFDLITGKPLSQPFLGHSNVVLSVAFSPDGQTIVSASEDKTLRLWDINGNALGQPFQGHTDDVYSVAFSSDGQTIVSGSTDKTLRLWDINGNALGQPFQGHTDDVYSVAFSSDGQTIVSGSRDKTLRLWDTQTRKSIPNLSARVRRITSPQSIANDATFGDDQLNVKDEIEALAEVLMLRTLQPPVAVALLGSWGSGKSFGMHLIQRKVNEIRSQSITTLEAWGELYHPDHNSLQSPQVGHIYQIKFNAWTYAKSNLWASLMQEIFFELNRQISLEKQLGKILSQSESKNSTSSDSKQAQNSSSERLIDRFIYNPWQKIKDWVIKLTKLINNYFIRPVIYFCLQCIKWIDLIIVSLLWHLILLILIIVLSSLYFLCLVVDKITADRFNLKEIFKIQFLF